MEGNLKSSPELGYPSDTDDSKYICGLSTILVATIQEVKDRVSQIEFIFCSQIFPNFQSRSKTLHRRLTDAKKAAEDDWKKKERSLMSQIEDLLLEKQHAHDQIQQLSSSQEENKTRLTSTKAMLKKHELEKKQLLDRLETLERNEEIIGELKRQLEQRTSEMARRKELQEKLLEEIELKDQMVLAEQTKRRDLFEEFNKLKMDYKHLKSQYMFLVRKTVTMENKQFHNTMQEDKNLPRPHLSKRSLQDLEENDQGITRLAPKPKEVKIGIVSHEVHEGGRDVGLLKRFNTDSHINLSSSSSSIPPRHIVFDAKLESSSGPKRASSCWRETRTHQGPGGVDPHDDFLATPMEIVRNLNKDHREEAQVFPVPPPQDMDFNNSDDETQDLNAETGPPLQHISFQGPAKKGFKYVEPVRKKVERENLKGVECKQCKKFYDAVLSDGGGNSNGMNTTNMRCEHHDGVSRHRYRYCPPMTPEGFWNIGFDSDI